MKILQLASSLITLIVNPPTPHEIARLAFEEDLTATPDPTPLIPGYCHRSFVVKGQTLSCLYYAKQSIGEDGLAIEREVVTVEVVDRTGLLVVAFKNGFPTAWRMGIEKAYRPWMTFEEARILQNLLGAMQNAVAMSANQGAQAT